MRLPSYDEAQERFVIANAQDFTANELAKALGLKQMVLYGLRDKHKLQFKKPNYSWNKLSAQNRQAKKQGPPKVTDPRPPAIYTQSPSPYGIASEARHL